MAPGQRNIWLAIFSYGGKMSFSETYLGYVLPWFFAFGLRDDVASFFRWNLVYQIIWFVLIASLPTYFTNKMTYVEVAWPWGCVGIALNCIINGTGWIWRKIAIGGIVLVHHVAVGFVSGYVLYPFRFNEDMPRYVYARKRFENYQGATDKLWTVKMQFDVWTHAYTNAVLFTTPIMLICFNDRPQFYSSELFGIVSWVFFWLWANMADRQKSEFLASDPGPSAVVGMHPYDTKEYWLWTKCRHPNIFGEWMLWSSYLIMGSVSLVELASPGWAKAALFLTFWFLMRSQYDSHLYLGIEAEEYYAVKKAPATYTKYQKKVKVFFPFEMFWVDHGREAYWPRRTGWPYAPKKVKKCKKKRAQETTHEEEDHHSEEDHLSDEEQHKGGEEKPLEQSEQTQGAKAQVQAEPSLPVNKHDTGLFRFDSQPVQQKTFGASEKEKTRESKFVEARPSLLVPPSKASPGGVMAMPSINTHDTGLFRFDSAPDVSPRK